MAPQSDILRKLDALLNKHRSAGADEVDIPTLSEVVDAEAAPAEVPAAPIPDSQASALSDAEVEALARDIFKRVMGKLNTQISSDLREHLNERLSSIIDSTVAAALADFKQDLANTVGDAIAEALLARAENMESSAGDPHK